MYINERPINKKEEDFLGRTEFSEKLAKSLYDWKEKESLVISLTGKWGSGKSSVLNLVKEYINNDDKKDKPTIIDFNPWMFSDLDNLCKQFFFEISKELKLKNESKNDKKLAQKIHLYAELLNLLPPKETIINLSSILMIGLGFLGITASHIINWLHLSINIIKSISFFVGIFFILIVLIKSILQKTSKFLLLKSKISNKSINRLKKEIQDELYKREKKLLIIIDDIDRLNQNEIKQILKLIKINADFPSTIYLLAYDSEVIEKNLGVDNILNGKKYIEKIVQVNFNIPRINKSKVKKYLFKELDRILSTLPESHNDYFNQEYWTKIYHSGFKNLFNTIRDVKRYISSLEFNISLLSKETSIEVNPIDFIAIEAIRVFNPLFYNILKSEKELFTMSRSINSPILGDENKVNELRKEQFEKIINNLQDENKENIKELIFSLFPKLATACSKYGYTSSSSGFFSDWRKELRVCSPIHFDTYFTLIPGGDEEEISQFEIDSLLSTISNAPNFEKLLIDYQNKNKFKDVIDRFQDYTGDEKKIKNADIKNIIQVFFNISDKLQLDNTQIFDFPINLSILSIIERLLQRFENKENYLIIKEAITNSSSLTLPLSYVSSETQLIKKDEKKSKFSNEQIKELQNICLTKIEETKLQNSLLNLEYLPSILYNWSEWSNFSRVQKFIESFKDDNEQLLKMLDKFFTITTSNYDKRFKVKQNKRLSVDSLKKYIDPNFVIQNLTDVKEKNNEFYQSNKDLIEKILDNIKNDDYT